MTTEGRDQALLATLIGGWRGALETILPPLAFVSTFVATNSVGWAVSVALVLGAVFAVWRIAEGKRPTRAVTAFLVVVISAYVAVKLDSAIAFFWPRVLINLVSAAAFALSVLIRWPLIGVIIGPIVGTRMRWRSDPALLRAYGRATWPWVVLCLVRAAVLFPLIESNLIWGLAVTGAIFYGLVILTVLASWRIIQRSLPTGHPGMTSNSKRLQSPIERPTRPAGRSHH